MSALNDFIKDKIDGRFSFEITLDQVIIRFQKIPEGEHWHAINLTDMDELARLRDLLDGRSITFEGDDMSYASISAIKIEKVIV